MITSAETTKSSSTKKIPKWLRHTQYNSWEGEILISGGAIFTLLQIAGFLALQKVFFSENYPFVGLDEVLIISMVAVKGVTLSFTLHLFLRGLWISLLCVNGSFPGGVNFSRLKLAERYQQTTSPSTLTPQLLSLDKICGLIFYAGFVFVLFLLGLFFCALVGLIFSHVAAWLNTIFITFLILYFVDFIFAGPLRKNRSIGRLFYPVYVFFNLLTLGVLYRKSLQIIFSNIGKSGAIFFVLVFTATTLALSYLSLYPVLRLTPPFEGRPFPGTENNQGVRYIDRFYIDELTPTDNIRWFAIESRNPKGKWMRVFINYHWIYSRGINETNNVSFDKIVTLQIDNVTVRNIDWLNELRTQSHQQGIMAMIPVDSLSAGKHILALNVGDDYYKKNPTPRIPFWKE
jgi:hypothetical protein